MKTHSEKKENTSRTIQYEKKTISQPPIHKILQTYRNDIPTIQRYTFLGNFASVPGMPPTPERQDLDLVFQQFSRITHGVLGKMDNDPLVNIIFQTGPAGGLGLTQFEALVGGIWQDLDDICDPFSPNYPLGLLLTPATPLQMIVTIDNTLHNIPPNNNLITATLAHEINVHLIHIYPWFLDLRSGAYTPVQIRARWRVTGIDGGLATPANEHATFAAGNNRSYNINVQQISNALGAPANIPFIADVHADMNFHHVGPGPQNYPI